MRPSALTEILVAGCVRQDAEVLAAHLRTLAALEAPEGCSLRFLHINDGATFPSDWQGVVWPAAERPADALYAVDDVTHRWNVSAFEHLAAQKQRLLQYAADQGYAAVLMVDSDLLLEPSTLQSLW